jgi:hypothetical protein
MTMFLKTTSDQLINADDVVSIIEPRRTLEERKRNPARPNLIANLRKGEQVTLAGVDVGDLYDRLQPIIPANPGWYVLYYYPDDEGKGLVERELVIGWRSSGMDMIPVLLEYHQEDESRPILAPDGRVIHPYNRSYENEAEWLATVRQEHLAKLKKTVVNDGQSGPGGD